MQPFLIEFQMPLSWKGHHAQSNARIFKLIAYRMLCDPRKIRRHSVDALHIIYHAEFDNKFISFVTAQESTPSI